MTQSGMHLDLYSRAVEGVTCWERIQNDSKVGCMFGIYTEGQ